MADDVARLGIQVDSASVKTATADLAKLNQEAKNSYEPLRAMEAAAKRNGETLEQYRQRMANAGQNIKQLGAASKEAAAGMAEVSKASNDNAAATTRAGMSAGELRSIFRLMAREANLVGGPLGGIIRDFGTFTVGASRLSLVLTASVIGFAAVTAGATAATIAYAKFEAQQARVANALAVTGRAGSSGLTPATVEASARGNAASGTQSIDDVRAASAAILRFRIVSEENFDAVMKAAKDLAATGFTDLKGAAEAIAKSMKDPANAADEFSAMGLKLSDSTQKAALSAAGLGDKAAAARIILKAWSDQIGGTDTRAADTLSAAWGRLANQSQTSLENLGAQVSKFLMLRQAIDAAAGALERYNNQKQPSTERSAALTEAIKGRFQPSDMAQGAGLSDIGPNALGGQLGLGDVGKRSSFADLSAEQTDRAKKAAMELSEAWGGIAIEQAKVLQGIQDQINLTNAKTEQEKINVQWSIEERNARLAGADATNAILQADLQRQAIIGQINAGLDAQLKSLQDQAAIMRGTSEVEQARIKAAQDYKKAVDAGGDSLKAGAVAAQEIANARTREDAREQAQADADAAQAAQQKAQANQTAAAAAEREARAAAQMAAHYEQVYQDLKNLPFGLLDNLGTGGLFDSKQGGKSQFNPQGYTLTNTANAVMQAAMDANNKFLANRTADDIAGAAYKGAGGNAQLAALGLLTKSSFGDSRNVEAVMKLADALSEPSQKTQIYQASIAKLQSEPLSLARDMAIQQLTQAIKDQTDATKANTEVVSDVLSPYYSQDPRGSKLGFRAFATGGVAMTETYARIAENEPEAVIPLSRLPGMMNAANSNQRPVHVVINVQGNADASTVAALKRTAFQNAQTMRRAMA